MIFFDTNVLIYFTINQDKKKFDKAQKIVLEAIEHNTFFISPLVLSEYIFVLSKYKLIEQHKNKVLLFSEYADAFIDNTLVIKAYDICQDIDFCRNINDAMHLKIAEAYCTKIVTFDSDFKKLQEHTDIEIDILL